MRFLVKLIFIRKLSRAVQKELILIFLITFQYISILEIEFLRAVLSLSLENFLFKTIILFLHFGRWLIDIFRLIARLLATFFLLLSINLACFAYY